MQAYISCKEKITSFSSFGYDDIFFKNSATHNLEPILFLVPVLNPQNPEKYFLKVGNIINVFLLSQKMRRNLRHLKKMLEGPYEKNHHFFSNENFSTNCSLYNAERTRLFNFELTRTRKCI